VLDNWAGILCAGSMNRETTMVGAWSKLSRQRRTANIAGDPWRRQYESHGQFLSTAIGSLQRKADKRHETLCISQNVAVLKRHKELSLQCIGSTKEKH